MQTICMIKFNFRGDEKYVISVIAKIKAISKSKEHNHKEITFLFHNYYWEDEDELESAYRL